MDGEQRKPPATLTELFNQWLPLALQSGVNYFDFWKMTPEEIYQVCKAYQDYKVNEQKILIHNHYDLATMISSFVCAGLDGKKPPSIETIYPELFKDNEQVQKKEDMRSAMIKEQWLDFATRHNKNYRLKESEKV